MLKLYFKKIIYSLIFLLILYLFYNTVILSDEYKIKRQIKKLSKAILEKDTRKILSFISINYSDDFGLTYAIIFNNIEATFNSINEIDGRINDISVYTFKEKDKKIGIANLSFSGSVNFNSDFYDYLNISENKHLRIQLELIKELSGWKILRVIDIQN